MTHDQTVEPELLAADPLPADPLPPDLRPVEPRPLDMQPIDRRPAEPGPPDLRPPAPGAQPWLAGVVLLLVAFLAGLALGQGGSSGQARVPTGPTPAPASQAPATSPDTTPVGTAPSAPVGAPADFDLFWEALEKVRNDYVGRSDLEDRELTYGAIRGMIEALGDTGHTIFLTREQVEREEESLNGQVVGIGALIGERAGRAVILSVIKDGPAERAGVRAGDVLLEVDGAAMEGLDPPGIAARVRGRAGTTVVIVVERPSSAEELEFSIVREEIQFPVAAWAMVPGTEIALIRLLQFSDGAGAELRAHRDAAIAAGAESFILDLRSNPGGFVHEAVNTASLFLDGDVVYIRETADDQRIPESTNPDIPPSDLPLVVLIDGGSASAAEIVAGALAVHGRAQLVGETTVGTGTLLRRVDLSDGSALRLATERWLTPDGEWTFEQGIEPTIEVSLAIDQAPLEPDEVGALDPDDVDTIIDAQLLRAIQLLRGPPATPE
jgi:carboxyl-terminal processing protease